MRSFSGTDRAQAGWTADWRLDDPHRTRPGEEVHLLYHDLTEGAGAYVAEAWVSLGYDERNAEAWIPRLMVQRKGAAPLASTFVSVLVPYAGTPSVAGVRRLPLAGENGGLFGDSHVAIEITLSDGRQDLIVALDADRRAGPAIQADWDLEMDGALCWARKSPQGKVSRMALAKGMQLRVGQAGLTLPAGAPFREAAAQE
jgi:hypothetical protein